MGVVDRLQASVVDGWWRWAPGERANGLRFADEAKRTKVYRRKFPGEDSQTWRYEDLRVRIFVGMNVCGTKFCGFKGDEEMQDEEM